MRKEISAVFFISLFLLSTVALVHAAVTVESTIDENIYVVINVANLDQTIYDAAKTSQIFNASSIMQIIVQNLRAQNRTNVTYDAPFNATYDNDNRAVQVSFFLGGTDIITSNTNRTSLGRDFEVQTGWRKFKANLTSNVTIDFATDFAEPVEKWQQIAFTDTSGNVHPSFYFETGEIAQLGKMAFRFILPSTASDVKATGDTITYDVPMGLADVLIGSPFPILAVIMIVVLIALVYRRLK